MNRAIQAELVLTFAFKQHTELCKELSSHFGSELRDKEDGVERLITWLQTKYGVKQHGDKVKIINSFLDTSRQKDEDLINFISRFEQSYAEVKKMGEIFSPTCLSVLLVRQAQLNVTVDMEFDFEETKA